jgi:CRISPR-associated protein Cas1
VRAAAGVPASGLSEAAMLPDIHPLPIKERLAMIFLERGHLDVIDGAFVLLGATGTRTHVPILL